MSNLEQGILKKIALYSLFGYFLSTTFSHALGQNFLGLALLLTIIILFKNKIYKEKPRFTKFNIFILLFLGWSILSALFGSTPLSSLFILKEEWLFLMIPTAAFLIRDEKTARTALRLFAISAIIMSLYAVWQHFGGMDLYRGTQLIKAPSYGYRAVGTFTHTLTFGNYCAVASALLLGIASCSYDWRNKLIFYLGFLLTATATIFTYSRGSIIALAGGIIVFLIWIERKHFKLVLPLIAVVIVIILFAAPDILGRFTSNFKMEWEGKSGVSRISIWRTSLKMGVGNPIFGVGPGNFGEQYVNYRDEFSNREFGHGHNDILNMSAYGGFPMAIFYLGFWVAIIVRMIKALKKVTENNLIRGIILGTLLASIVFYFTSMFEATFADEEIRLFLMAIWGLFFGMERLIKKRLEKTENIEIA